MFLSNLSINRPVFTAMVTIALMTLGMLAVRNIGVDLFPDVSFPVVVVNTVYPGAGPEEVEQQVTRIVEESVSSVNGVDRVSSFSRDSISTVIIEFKIGTDVKAAATDVREKMAGLRYNLPDDIEEPIIQRFDPSAVAIMNYVVSSGRSPSETRRLAEDVIKPRLEAIDGVASVKVVGGQEREVKVLLDRDRLEALGLSIAQVTQQLGSEGFDLPAGRIIGARSELNIKTEGRFRSIDELGEVVVASLASGSQVRLRDVARVVDGFEERRSFTRLDGEEAVTLEIQKQSGSNTVAIADGVMKAVDRLLPQLPEDVRLIKAIDTSEFIRRNVESVEHEIVFGGLMAVLVVFLFMLDWRSTFITSLSLPTSVITTFFVMWMLGFTFNMMSLLALSLSIGLLIDDAVVVRENIFRHMEMGKDRVTASRDGTAEIGLAVMATTFTIVAVFVPVAFMGGIVGMMFKQFGLTIAAAVLVSLFVSFTIDPMMSARVMKAIEPGHHERLKHHRWFGPIVRGYDKLDAFYRDVLEWVLNHKITVVVLATLMFVGSIALTGLMGKEFVPPQDRSEFVVNLEMPAGTSLAEMDRVVLQVEKLIREASSEIRTLYSTVGFNDEVNEARVRVFTTKVLERTVTQWEIQDAIRERLTTIPGLKSNVSELGIMEGAEQMPITLFVRGDDYEKLKEYARMVLDVVATTPGVVDADMSYRDGKIESSIRVDRSRAADLGVSVGTIAQTARIAVEGAVVAKFRDGDRDIDVRVQLDPEQRTSAESLGELSVPAQSRRMGGLPNMAAMFAGPQLVKVKDVADIVSTSGPVTIERENRQRQIIVEANLSGVTLGEALDGITRRLAELDAPQGTWWTAGGQAEQMMETFDNMFLALGVAVLFIFFVLASQFESVIHPFTIMFALPLAIVGAFVALFLAGQSIGMSSMIGIILLMGLVTKNAILLVDYTNELREKHGMKMVPALLQAGPTRLRPILMTSAAMVLGMLPSAIATGEGSEFKSPMATGVIGGVIASTFLTLVVVPVVYTWMDRFTIRGRRERAEERAALQAGHDAPPAAGSEPHSHSAAAMTALSEEA